MDNKFSSEEQLLVEGHVGARYPQTFDKTFPLPSGRGRLLDQQIKTGIVKCYITKMTEKPKPLHVIIPISIMFHNDQIITE